MTPETPAKVTATTLPDEPRTGNLKTLDALDAYVKYSRALLQSFNAERLRAEAAEAEVAELTRWRKLLNEGAAERIAAVHECAKRADEYEDLAEQAEARAEAMAKAINAALSHLKFKDKANGDAGVYGGMIDCATEVLDTAIEQGAQRG